METFAGDVGAAVSDDNLLEFGKAGANGEKLLQLWRANNENDLGAAMLEDVGHAVGGFVKIDRYGDGTRTVDGEIGGRSPGGGVGKKAHAGPGLSPQVGQRGGGSPHAREA